MTYEDNSKSAFWLFDWNRFSSLRRDYLMRARFLPDSIQTRVFGGLLGGRKRFWGKALKAAIFSMVKIFFKKPSFFC